MDADTIARIEALPGNTMIVFDDVRLADEYIMSRAARGHCGLTCRVEDTRTGSGLLVQWRDPIKSADLPQRQAEARWMLEEVLAGRLPRPSPGQVTDISAEMRERAREARDG